MNAARAIWIGLCALALLAAPALAQPRCKPVADPVVRLDFVQPKPTVDSMPMAELRLMSRDGLGEHEQTLGLYKAELRTGMKVEFSTAGDNTAACIALRDVAIDIRLVERRIYLARELQRGTCRYDATLAHEQQHARIDDTVFARELPAVKEAIVRAAAENGLVGPVAVRDLPAHRADIGERMQRALRHELDRVNEIRRREQGGIDTPESYRREAQRCPGE
jgi:hypothetical protein